MLRDIYQRPEDNIVIIIIIADVSKSEFCKIKKMIREIEF